MMIVSALLLVLIRLSIQDDRHHIKTNFSSFSGDNYRVFRPYEDDMDKNHERALVATSGLWISEFVRSFDNLDKITNLAKPQAAVERARDVYIQFIMSIITARAYGTAEKAVYPQIGKSKGVIIDYDDHDKQDGLVWTYLGYTMTGYSRINHLINLVKDVIRNDVPGSIMETGVWRGGSSIIARAVVHAYDQHERLSFVCDSFRGLPPGDPKFDKKDVGWDHTTYLEVNEETVANHFRILHLLDHNTVFVKGFFNESMPPLAKNFGDDTKLAILRLDGDIYQSTVDVLYHMYDKVSINGYILIDDWDGYPAKTACLDFFEVHNIKPEIVPMDIQSVYWKKTEDPKIQYWRYEQQKFKANQS